MAASSAQAASVRAERRYFTAEQKDGAAVLALAEARRKLADSLAHDLALRQEVRFAASPARNDKAVDLIALVYAAYVFEPDLLIREESPERGAAIATQRLRENALQERIVAILADPEKLDLYARAAERENIMLAAGAVLAEAWPYAATGQGASQTPGPTPPSALDKLRAVERYFSLLPYLNGIWHEPERVHAAMRDAMALDPECALYPNAAGEAALLLGLGHEAREAQNLAIKLDPSFARAFHARGAAHLSMQLPALAVNDFSEAIRRNPDNATYRLDRAAAWRLRDETEFMCVDLYDACALGECRAYEWAVVEKLCPVRAGR
jgi:tetratricopeptide (TPR) repeat protein